MSLRYFRNLTEQHRSLLRLDLNRHFQSLTSSLHTAPPPRILRRRSHLQYFVRPDAGSGTPYL
nr:MAG TPA: hypothetical protein [Caudoviricetes sp.]